MSDGGLREDSASIGRHEISSSVSSGSHRKVGDGDNFIQVDVDITVSGAESDRPDTADLHAALEAAVAETLRGFSGGGE